MNSGHSAPHRIFISAGEVSGDVAGARLVAELLRRNPDIRVCGTGGPRMRDAGAEIDADTTHLGVIGITDCFTILPSLWQAFRTIRHRIERERPDVAVLIGNDVFNLVVARWLRRRGIETIAYFPPQVWIWKSLARSIARSYDTILASFPDEHAVYSRVHQPARVPYVGHYLADILTPPSEAQREAARASLGIAAGGRLIALLPGSRAAELRHLGPVLFGAAESLLDRDATLRFVVPVPDAGGLRAMSRAMAGRAIAPHATICADSHSALRAADFAVLASGTATLEAGLMAVPMVIVYKNSPMTRLSARVAIRCGLIESYTVGLPNLVLGKPVVPEFLQERATPPLVADEVWSLLSDGARRDGMRRDLRELSVRLGGGRALGAAADAILERVAAGHRRARCAMPADVDDVVPDTRAQRPVQTVPSK